MAIITGQSAFSVTPFTLPVTVNVGDTASHNLAISGGVPPYSVRVISGRIPAGLALSGSTLAGTYTTSGTSAFALMVSDLADNNLTISYSSDVRGASAPIAPTIAFAIATQAVSEGNSGTTTVANVINVTRNGVTGALTVNLAYSGTATSGVDYATPPATVTIPAGHNTASFDILVNGDTTVEPDETVIITATLAGYSSATASRTITIANDDVVASAPFTKLMIDGDSITAATNSWANRWMAANPSVPASNISVAGATIRADLNPTNNMVGRIPNIVSYAPSDLCILIGANDIKDRDAPTFLSILFDYVAQVKAAVPGIRVHVGTILPTTEANRLNINARRAIINPALRAAVGNQIDSIIPFGEHPIIGPDTAPDTAALYYDKLHPAALGYYHMLQVASDALAPIVGAATAVTPSALPFFDVSDAPLSADVYSRARVTGMKPGTAVSVIRTGSGDFRVGASSAGTTGTVVNGDVITARIPSSASNDTSVTQTLTAGTTSKTATVRTRPSAYVSTTTLDPANKYAQVTLSNGNLTATGNSSVGACHPIRSTQSRTTELFYFEVMPPNVTAQAYISIMDSTVTLNGSRTPGFTSGFTNAGLTMMIGGQVIVYTKGQTLSNLDLLLFPSLAVGVPVGMAVDGANGVVWLRGPDGYFHGDPEMRDGGFKLAAPLAQYWAFGGPRGSDPVTTNYGASAFTYPVPVGFRPFL